MNILIQRALATARSIPGEAFIGSAHAFYTLERPGVAILSGRYPVTVYFSPHLQRRVPLLNNVPGRSFIEMHWGSFSQNSDGCILVGEQRAGFDEIIGTQEEFDRLMPLVEAAVNTQEGCWVEVLDPASTTSDLDEGDL